MIFSDQAGCPAVGQTTPGNNHTTIKPQAVAQLHMHLRLSFTVASMAMVSAADTSNTLGQIVFKNISPRPKARC